MADAHAAPPWQLCAGDVRLPRAVRLQPVRIERSDPGHPRFRGAKPTDYRCRKDEWSSGETGGIRMKIPYTTEIREDTGLYNGKVGMWLFLASEVMLFGALFSGYVFLRIGAWEGEWPHGLL